VVAGRGGVVAGGSVSVRHSTGTAVRGGWHTHHHHHSYRRGWHAKYPGAWFVAGWTTRAVWRASTWPTTYVYVGATAQPVYYDYGNTIIYEGDTVYQDGQAVATAEEYYQQAETLAGTGQPAQEEAAPAADEWLSLGVFAATKEGESQANRLFQLAINKDGVIRGNYEDMLAGNVEPINGSVDKKTQRVAWTIGDNKTIVIETGLSNLTKDEAPALVHFSAEDSQQVLLVRLPDPEAEQAEPEQGAQE
jgi:hypothetical protein